MPVDVDHAHDETTDKIMSCYPRYLGHCLIENQSARQATVALSSGESELCALCMGCAAGLLVMSCLKGMQLEHLTLTGRPMICSDSSSASGTTKRSGAERIKHMGPRHLWSKESLRKYSFGLNVIDTSANTADMGTKYVSATTRRTLLTLLPLYFGDSLGIVTTVAASREAGKTPNATTAAHATVHNTTEDLFTANYCWWIW